MKQRRDDDGTVREMTEHETWVLTGGHPLRPIQRKALQLLLTGRRHLAVSAPTGAGKSMIGHLALMDALRRGRHGVFVTPLRALVQAQGIVLADRLARLPSASLPEQTGAHLSTQDHPLDEGVLDGEAPQLLVTTPEGLDALWRRANSHQWIGRIGTVVIDEAHMLNDTRRGATLEHLLATCLNGPHPARLVLLSAAMAGSGRLRDWLHPCDYLETRVRHPPLHRHLITLEANASIDDRVEALVTQEVLPTPDGAVLVFVHRRADTERLAARLAGARAYHAGMAAEARTAVASGVLDGTIRVVVSTTALAMGVDLPVSHVIIRDTTFHGHGPVPATTLAQMLGRAGRGEDAGHGFVLLRATGGWSAQTLERALREDDRVELESALHTNPDPTESVATMIVARLAQGGCLDLSALRKHLARTLAGPGLNDHLPASLRWLTSDDRRLVTQDPRGRYLLTPLGVRGARVLWPLRWTAAMGQFLRDLLTADPEDRLLFTLTHVDLVVLGRLMMSTKKLEGTARETQRLRRELNNMDTTQATLFTRWGGRPEGGDAEDLLGSLGLDLGRGPRRSARAWATLARATRDGLRRDRDDATTPQERDDWRWWLRGLATLFHLDVVDGHLQDEGASLPRVGRVRDALERLQRLAWRHPLGRRVTTDSGGHDGTVGTVRGS